MILQKLRQPFHKKLKQQNGRFTRCFLENKVDKTRRPTVSHSMFGKGRENKTAVSRIVLIKQDSRFTNVCL